MTYKQHTYTNPDGSEVTIYIHPDFDVSEIGRWTIIGDGAEIGNEVRIGRWTIIGDGVKIGNEARIGDWARIGDGTIIGDGARIGNWARIGDGAEIGNEARIGDWARIGSDNKTLYPVYIAPLPNGPKDYYITITKTTLTIGCEMHSLSDWWDFDDKRIMEMDGKKALKYWREYKDFIFKAAALHGWKKPEETS